MKYLRSVVARLRTYVALLGARSSSRQALIKPARRVLVICYGNIYRSAFLGSYLAQHARNKIEVKSTGFHSKIGRPSPDRHIAMAARHGVDLRQHRSSRIERADIEWADVLVIMDRHNWQALWQQGAPAAKIVWAGALLRGHVEIRDPYEMTDQAAEQTITRLCEAGDSLLERLIQ